MIIVFSFGFYYKYQNNKQVQSGLLKNEIKYFLVNRQNKIKKSISSTIIINYWRDHGTNY